MSLRIWMWCPTVATMSVLGWVVTTSVVPTFVETRRFQTEAVRLGLETHERWAAAQAVETWLAGERELSAAVMNALVHRIEPFQRPAQIYPLIAMAVARTGVTIRSLQVETEADAPDDDPWDDPDSTVDLLTTPAELDEVPLVVPGRLSIRAQGLSHQVLRLIRDLRTQTVPTAVERLSIQRSEASLIQVQVELGLRVALSGSSGNEHP